MSKTKHTEGLLKLHEVGGLLCLATLDDLSLLTVATERDEFGDKTVFGAVYKSEDAKRLAACWNACQSFTTEELEYGMPEKLSETERVWETTLMQAVGEDGPKSVVEAIDVIKLQRDTAWAELREIREVIKADENESTVDEVRSLVAKNDKLQKIVDEKKILKRIDSLYERLTELEEIATAVEADIDTGRPLEYNVEHLRDELIRARKALGILPEQEQTTTLDFQKEEPCSATTDWSADIRTICPEQYITPSEAREREDPPCREIPP